MKIRTSLAMALAAGLASSAGAQLIAGEDVTSQGIWAYNFGTSTWTQIASGTGSNAWGLAADDAARKLYISTGSTMYTIDYSLGINGAPFVPVNSGAFGRSLVGLAFGGGTLYGCTNISPEAIFTVDTGTGASTQLFAYDSGFDLGGLDYNPTDGLLYATSDSTSVSGRGLYQINQNTTVITFVTPYPTFAGTASGTDIDGLAIGNDRAYFVVDEAGEVGVYNLITNTVESPFVNPFTASATFSAGAWAPGMFGPPPQFDASIGMGDSPDPLYGLGNNITYTLNINNFGSDPVNGTTVTMNLSPDVTYVSDTGGGNHSMGVVTFNLGTIPGGGSTNFTVTVTGDTGGFATTTANITINEADSNLLNNSASVTTEIIDVSNLPDPEVIYSEIVTSNTSLVPGGGGANFDAFNRPYRSPDGTRWILSGQSNIDTNFDEVIITGSGTTGTTRFFENDPAPWDTFFLLENWETPMWINDSGQFSFTGDVDGSTTIDQFIIFNNGTTTVPVFEEGVDEVPGFVGELFGTFDIGGLTNGGDSAVLAFSTAGALPTTQDDFALLGSTIVAQVGVTIPTNQALGASETWEFFDANDFHVSGDGAHYVLQGDLTGSTTGDDVLVVDGAVVIQEGLPVDGDLFIDGVSIITEARMEGDGTWLARGTNATSGTDWVVMNGEVVAYTDQSIGIPSGETWGNTTFANTFFEMAANNNGDYVIGGVVSSTDPERDAIILHVCADGTRTEVVRQGSPVDLDRNGQFDDGVFVDVFNDDDMFLTDDGWLYFTCDLEDALGGASLGQAFMRLQMPDCASPCVADLSGSSDPNDPAYGVPDGMVDSSDFFYFLDQFVAMNLGVADLSGSSDPNDPAYGVPDGMIDSADFFYFLDQFVAGCP